MINISEPFLAPMVPGGPYEPHVEPIPGQFDAADGAWQSSSGGIDGLYDDVFNFDTGRSPIPNFLAPVDSSSMRWPQRTTSRLADSGSDVFQHALRRNLELQLAVRCFFSG